jgi:hypothetical protein
VVELYAELCQAAAGEPGGRETVAALAADSTDPMAVFRATGLVGHDLIADVRGQSEILERVSLSLSALQDEVRRAATAAERREARLQTRLTRLAEQIEVWRQMATANGRGADTIDDPARPPTGARSGPADYEQLVQRARSVVEQCTPAGAVVAVASKGDDALVAFSGRHGWHFPQTEIGIYAGHYPPDGGSAVAHLESLRRRGATHVMFPDTSRWWLTSYPELGDHLVSTGRVVVDDDSCVVFALPPSAAEPVRAAATAPDVYGAVVAQVRDLTSAVLPPGSIVAVVTRGDDDLLRFDGPIGWHFPRSEDGGYAGWYPADGPAAIAHLEHLRESGAQFLAIPRPSFWWLSYYRELGRHLEAHYRRVLYQSRICLIFDLDLEPPSSLRHRSDP